MCIQWLEKLFSSERSVKREGLAELRAVPGTRKTEIKLSTPESGRGQVGGEGGVLGWSCVFYDFLYFFK